MLLLIGDFSRTKTTITKSKDGLEPSHLIYEIKVEKWVRSGLPLNDKVPRNSRIWAVRILFVNDSRKL